MSYARLGDIEFSGLFGLQTVSKGRTQRVVEIARITGKSSLQNMGAGLEQLSLSYRVHRAWLEPATHIANLVRKKEAGEVLQFVDGSGESQGFFVIIGFSETVEIQALDGTTISASIQVDLTEYVDPNPAATARRTAQAQGFASSADRIIAVQPIAPPRSPAQVTSQSVRQAEIQSSAAISNVQAVLTNPTQQQSLFTQARISALAARDSITTAVDRIQETAAIVQRAPQLLSTAQAVQANVAALITRLEEGDLTNALTASRALGDSLGPLAEAAQPLDLNLILRRPL